MELSARVARILHCACMLTLTSCGNARDPSADETSSASSATSHGASSSTPSHETQTTGPATGMTSDDSFIPCEPPPCEDGQLGCPCGADDACDGNGVCSAERCIEVEDDMVRVSAPTFCMGCDAANDDGCVSDELPAHEVRLAEFFIDRHEVTQAAYDACVQAGDCPIPDDELACANKWDPVMLADHPVVCVEHDWAVAYCDFVGKQLPTEAQWEAAARGPNGQRYPWGAQPPTCALTNYGPPEGECVDATTPVGSYPDAASPFGALDMAGNVWEHTLDWYAPDYYAQSPADDPKGPDSGSARVLRGGSYTSVDKFQRAAARDGSRAPWVTARNVGFRCVR